MHYGESHVLRGVSLSIRAGEAVGLLGRNGMGKTTLIRTIMGHVRASRGRIAIRGGDGSRMRAGPHRARRHRLCAGRARIFPNLSVRENLLVAARPGTIGPRRLAARADPRDVSAPGANGSTTAASSSPAASSRCSRSAARCRPIPICSSSTRRRRAGAADRPRDLADHRRDPRGRHRVADRRPQFPLGARQYRSRADSRKRACRPRRSIGSPDRAARRARGATRRLMRFGATAPRLRPASMPRRRRSRCRFRSALRCTATTRAPRVPQRARHGSRRSVPATSARTAPLPRARATAARFRRLRRNVVRHRRILQLRDAPSLATPVPAHSNPACATAVAQAGSGGPGQAVVN